MKNYLDRLPKSFLALAPLDDVTDTVFRQVVASCAPPDLFFTEFTNVDALNSAGRESALKRLKFTQNEKPLIAQIWGKTPQNFYESAKELVAMGFDGIDLNMGCPDKTVVKNGCCGGLINNQELALEIIKATKEGASGRIPVSVKTRLGFREFDPKWIRLILSQNLEMFTIHLRTVKEMSLVPAHWELMGEIIDTQNEVAPNTAIVGNGDVESFEQAKALATKYRLDGVMIGRGVFKDPFVFSRQSPWHNFSPEQKIEMYEKHVELFLKTWPNGERKIHTLNKFCKIYVNGFDGAKDLRDKLMHARGATELKDLIEKSLTD